MYCTIVHAAGWFCIIQRGLTDCLFFRNRQSQGLTRGISRIELAHVFFYQPITLPYQGGLKASFTKDEKHYEKMDASLSDVAVFDADACIGVY